MIHHRFALLCLATVVGCSEPAAVRMHASGLPADAAAAVIGTWALQSWNGNPLPAKYETGYGSDNIADWIDRIAAGSITLDDNATYVRSTTWRREWLDGSGRVEDRISTEQGGFTGSVASGTVTLNLFGGVTMRVAVSGNTMSAKYVVQDVSGPVVLGDVWAYQK